MRRLLLVLTVLANSALAESRNSIERQQQAVLTVQRNAAESLAKQSKGLVNSLQGYCHAQKSIELARQQWTHVMSAWMRLQGQQRGPDLAIERYWQVQFYPDKKDTTGRKMRHLREHSSAWSVEELADQSVAVQGVGAIEWLLFDESSWLSHSEIDCQNGVAITQSLNKNTDWIAKQWQAYTFDSMDEQVWASVYLALINSQLDYAMKKMSLMLGKPGKSKPYFAEAWRSQTSVGFIKTNLQAVSDLYLASGQGLDSHLRGRGESELADKVSLSLGYLISTWPANVKEHEMLNDKSGYQELLGLYNQISYVHYLLTEPVAQSLGVVVGFNSTDGD
ncbi:imelysin family protein [Vibrio sp. FNV 38]|nr:imelysin family protein [Vibrio sp. FNV 38]